MEDLVLMIFGNPFGTRIYSFPVLERQHYFFTV